MSLNGLFKFTIYLSKKYYYKIGNSQNLSFHLVV